MNYLIMFSYTVIFSVISACSHAQTIPQILDATVKYLNALYTSSHNGCLVYPSSLTSPIDCSGVIVHGKETDEDHVWIPDQDDSRQAVSFSYIRSDLPTTMLFSGSGFIYDQTARSDAATRLVFYCFYPFDAASDAPTDHPPASHGCGLPSTAYAPDPNGEFASCPQASVYTADDFITRYLVNGKPQMIVEDTCSFSANQEKSFATVLEIQKRTVSPYWNELITSTWTKAKAAKLPVSAFFYLTGREEDRSDALEYQRDYCAIYGKFMPVVRLDIGYKTANAFTGDPAEQQPCG